LHSACRSFESFRSLREQERQRSIHALTGNQPQVGRRFIEVCPGFEQQQGDVLSAGIEGDIEGQEQIALAVRYTRVRIFATLKVVAHEIDLTVPYCLIEGGWLRATL
jgi:hypothetical protein